MKKILLLPLMLLLAVACSTDADEIITNQDNMAVDSSSASTSKPDPELPAPIVGACYTTLPAHIENFGGLNPIWHFVADVPTPVATGMGFKVYLEYQATDCESFTTGTGTIFSKYGGLFTNPNTVLPYVEAMPSELLPCYRWRLRIYGVNGKQYSNVVCWQVTQWYDAPVG
ncbi:hypothetical protein ACLI09_07105 [Flavobacterium sp. RHBU_24]|uniref:hypothetical protein n=1 Tax=Flavobacterium sp. RHBU_24 TaxID=3391185 RepID=UPI003984CF23